MRYIYQGLIIGLFCLILLHKSARSRSFKSPESTHLKEKSNGLLSSEFPKTIFNLDTLVSSKLNVTCVFEIPRNEYLISFLFLHKAELNSNVQILFSFYNFCRVCFG